MVLVVVLARLNLDAELAAWCNPLELELLIVLAIVLDVTHTVLEAHVGTSPSQEKKEQEKKSKGG